MANLIEVAAWAAAVYQIAELDPLHGGPPDEAQGVGQLNIGPQQLANRTAWLKAELETLQQTLNDLTNGAPGALDTLNELAAALGDDPNFSATVLSMLGEAAPAGAVGSFAMDTPPTGWLECDGSELSRVSYASLYAAIGTAFGAGDGATTFNLPDLRGEFIRGWDNGRGVDAGRAFGSSQSDAFAQGEVGVRRLDASSAANVFDATGSFSFGPDGSLRQTITYNAAVDRAETRLRIGTFGVDETRPRNVALMYCIKF